MDSVSTIIILLYFVGLIAIGALASKKIKNSEDFLVAGRNLGFWTFTILIVASICSGMTILGVAGLGYPQAGPASGSRYSFRSRLPSAYCSSERSCTQSLLRRVM